MKYSQKYTLAAFLKPIEISTIFNMADWPLHITIVDVFAIELNVAIVQQMTDLLAAQTVLSLRAGQDATLGTTKVVLITKNSELQNLHDKVANLLELNRAVFNTPEFTREGFLAHSTIQKIGRLYKGDEIEITSVSLIDMFPKGDWRQRKVVNNFKLKGA